MNIEEFNNLYMTQSPIERRKMSIELLQSEFERLVSEFPTSNGDIDNLDALKFIAHKSFNNYENQAIIRKKWGIDFIFTLIFRLNVYLDDPSQRSKQKNNYDRLISVLDILSNVTGITTRQCEFNFKTPKNTSLQVLPIQFSSNHSYVPTQDNIETLIKLLSTNSLLTRRYAARCLLNFSNAQYCIQLTADNIDILTAMTQNQDELLKMYSYAVLRNYYTKNNLPINPEYVQEQEFQTFLKSLVPVSQSTTQSKQIQRVEFEKILNSYETKSLWRWFWSQLGLMSKESGTIFCLKQLLDQNPSDASFSPDAILEAINDKNNYDSKKDNRYRMFQSKEHGSTDCATDKVISEIIRAM